MKLNKLIIYMDSRDKFRLNTKILESIKLSHNYSVVYLSHIVSIIRL